jgi:hypothetical protein
LDPEYRILAIGTIESRLHPICSNRPALIRQVTGSAGSPICAQILKEWIVGINRSIRRKGLDRSTGIGEWEEIRDLSTFCVPGEYQKPHNADQGSQQGAR